MALGQPPNYLSQHQETVSFKFEQVFAQFNNKTTLVRNQRDAYAEIWERHVRLAQSSAP
jgi:hypothetical protein